LPGKEVFIMPNGSFIQDFILEKRSPKSIEDLPKTELVDPLEMYGTAPESPATAIEVVVRPGKPTQSWAHMCH
jgi:hypothetical protein